MLKDYVVAENIDEVLNTLSRGNARIIAGGTDLMLDLRSGDKTTDALVDITQIQDLKTIEEVEGNICIGAAVTHAEVASSSLIREKAAALAEAADSVGSLQIRNTGTVVGNIVNAQPAADAAVALIALDAEVEVYDKIGLSYQPVENLYAGVGQCKVDSCASLVKMVRFPALKENQGSGFVRLAKRKALALPMLNVAAVVSLQGNKVEWVRICVAPVSTQPVRVPEAEEYLKGKEASDENMVAAGELVSEKANPRDSALRGSGAYRKSVVAELVRRAVKEAVSRANQV